jgi:4-hydroxy-tetrahydrodipicolinate reductase
MRYAIVGNGRMGRAIDEQARRRGHALETVVTRGGLAAAALARVDVAFEFSVPDAAASNVRELLRRGVSVICGTTGWSPPEELRRAAAEAECGLVVAPNFSIGMQLFYRLVEQAGALFGSLGQHDPYVWEHHHRTKRDAPSGTARRLAEILARADPRGYDASKEGGAVVSVRAGAEPGRHIVGFDSEHDIVRLEHAARGRSGFALGAVLAAEWLDGKTGYHGLESLVDEALSRKERSP